MQTDHWDEHVSNRAYDNNPVIGSRKGAHYPSDVMVGMSIGHFFGRMFSDAFLGDGLSGRVALAFEPAPGGGEIVWQMKF
jgi:hypothetical protein